MLRIPFGVAANRSGNHKAFMLAGFASLIAAGILLIMARSPVVFFAARFLAGLASATWVSFTVFYTGYHAESDTGKAIASLMIANNCGTLSSYLLGIVLFDRTGITLMFIISIAAAVIGISLLLTVGKSGEDTASGPAAAINPMNLRGFGEVIKNRGLLLFSSIAALFQVITFATVMSFTPDHVRNYLGASGSALAFLSVTYSVACIIGAYWIRSKPGARVSHKVQMACSFCMSALYCIVVPNAGNIFVVYIMQMVGGIGQASAMTLAMSQALSDIPRENRSAAMGVYQCVYSLGMTLGPVIMGAILGALGRFNYACYFILIFCAAGLALSLFAIKDRRTPEQQTDGSVS